jgi:ABC-type Fe3+ transport system substrate-binding protein
LVVSGEVPLTFTAVDSNVRLAAARGAPVTWLPMDLVPVNAGNVAALANTQRPNAALLFIDFLIGPDGQKLLVDKLGYGGARKNMASNAGIRNRNEQLRIRKPLNGIRRCKKSPETARQVFPYS